jgi:hypothetical protein
VPGHGLRHPHDPRNSAHPRPLTQPGQARTGPCRRIFSGASYRLRLTGPVAQCSLHATRAPQGPTRTRTCFVTLSPCRVSGGRGRPGTLADSDCRRLGLRTVRAS